MNPIFDNDNACASSSRSVSISTESKLKPARSVSISTESKLKPAAHGENVEECQIVCEAEPVKIKNVGKGVSKNNPSKGKTARSKKPDNVNSELTDLKNQLKELMGLIPVVKEIKQAYDNFNEEAENHSVGSCSQRLNENRVSPDLGSEESRVVPQHSGCVNEDDLVEGENVTQFSYFDNMIGGNDKKGERIADNIAKGITKVLSNGVDKDLAKSLSEKYSVPENCPRLEVIQCNEEVFKQASMVCKSKDVSLQKIQFSLLKGLTAVSKAMSKLMDCADNDQKEWISDGVVLLSHASHELDIYRRHEFKREINQEYSSLCTAAFPVEDKLFGRNINDRLKDMNEAMKVAKVSRRFQPYKSSKRFPFLGRGQQWAPRGGGNFPSFRQNHHRQREGNFQNKKRRFNPRT